MRNKFPGTCYRCGKTVEKQAGNFERYKGGWRVIHAECVLEQRAEKEAAKRQISDEGMEKVRKWLTN